MQRHTHFTPRLMFIFPDIIGFYSVIEANCRASDAFLSSPSALFSRALLANPRAMGAACPSSLKLAQTIADLVIPPDNDSHILELGGGTGIVTISRYCGNPRQRGQTLPAMQSVRETNWNRRLKSAVTFPAILLGGNPWRGDSKDAGAKGFAYSVYLSS